MSAAAAVWPSFETEVENKTEAKPTLVAKERDRFALPTDRRKAEAVREKRRLLYAYLVAGPKVFFKSIKTMSREMTVAWAWDDPKGWSPRTIDRLLADLQKLGLWEPAGKRGPQGTRIRRINIARKCESGASTAPQKRANSRINTEDEREYGVSTQPERESGPATAPKVANLARPQILFGAQGFVLDVESKPSEVLHQDHLFKDPTHLENRRVATNQTCGKVQVVQEEWQAILERERHFGNYDPRPITLSGLKACVGKLEGYVDALIEDGVGWLLYDDGSSEAYVPGQYEPVWHSPELEE